MDAFLSILPKLVGAGIVLAIFFGIAATYWVILNFVTKKLVLGKSVIIKTIIDMGIWTPIILLVLSGLVSAFDMLDVSYISPVLSHYFFVLLKPVPFIMFLCALFGLLLAVNKKVESQAGEHSHDR